MKLPRLRFRLWWLMVLVAIVAASLAAETTRHRWVHFRRLAAYHAHAEACYSMALVSTQRDIEEGERLNKGLSVAELAVERASEPFHRLIDSKEEYKAYRKLVNLPMNRGQ